MAILQTLKQCVVERGIGIDVLTRSIMPAGLPILDYPEHGRRMG